MGNIVKQLATRLRWNKNSSIIKFHKPSIEVWLNDWLDGKDLWHQVWR